jgi:hypothetical protein
MLSSYCPQPFIARNNIPDSVTAYASIADHRVASPHRDKIVSALSSPPFRQVLNRVAHDEVPTRTEIVDGLEVLKGCRKPLREEIERLRLLYKHRASGRAIDARPRVSTLEIMSAVPIRSIEIVGYAAAATQGAGISWVTDEIDLVKLSNEQVVLVKSDVLAPIATTGNYILLDAEGASPNDGDLVAATVRSEVNYLRRLCKRQRTAIVALRRARVFRRRVAAAWSS